MSERLRGLLEAGVAGGVFPSARAVVLRDGRPVFEGGAGPAGPATLYDLASLTKVLGTTAAFLGLWAEGALEPDTPLARDLPRAALAAGGTTARDLLAHRAGLPPFVPFFADALRAEPGLLDPGCPPETRAAVRRAVAARVLATPPAASARARADYGDVAFLVLGEWLAAVDRRPLDAVVAGRVAGPLGLGLGYRRLSARPAAPPAPGAIAPTGATRPRPPAPGQEGLWGPLPAGPSAPGEVDDDNAWVMDGVAGHAGLFGTAADVAAFGRAVLEELAGAGRLAPAALWREAVRRDAATPGSTRALGFDTRRAGDAGATSAGARLGERPAGAVGHTGFTGTSLWIDVDRRLVVALCTNRTALGRGETRIRDFRPRFHDAVVEECAGDR